MNRFRVVCLHGRLPFGTRPISSIRLQEMTLDHVEELNAYLTERARQQPLATLHTPDRFLARVSRTPGLKLSDFRIARDAAGKILGCAALWDPSDVQAFIPQIYHGFAQTIHSTLAIATRLRLARGTSAPGRAMPMRFLTHLACESAEAFHRLADDAFARLGHREFLAYLHFRGHWRTMPPLSMMSTSLPFALYMILPPNEEAAPVWPAPHTNSLPPEFDISWL
jgi:hypothetical protein